MAQQDPPDPHVIENELEQIQDKLRQLRRELVARRSVHVDGGEAPDDARTSSADE